MNKTLSEKEWLVEEIKMVQEAHNKAEAKAELTCPCPDCRKKRKSGVKKVNPRKIGSRYKEYGNSGAGGGDKPNIKSELDTSSKNVHNKHYTPKPDVKSEWEVEFGKLQLESWGNKDFHFKDSKVIKKFIYQTLKSERELLRQKVEKLEEIPMRSFFGAGKEEMMKLSRLTCWTGRNGR
jgi:hypothetical protein